MLVEVCSKTVISASLLFVEEKHFFALQSKDTSMENP